MVIFHSYVKLPEGTMIDLKDGIRPCNTWVSGLTMDQGVSQPSRPCPGASPWDPWGLTLLG